jgi:hypothetical protein
MSEERLLQSVVRLSDEQRQAFLEKFSKSRVAEAQRILQEKVSAIRCCDTQCVAASPTSFESPEELFTTVTIDGDPTDVPAVNAKCLYCGATYDPFTKERLP